MSDLRIGALLESLHDLVHRLLGIDYPHGHWWVTVISLLIFVIMPSWMAWHGFRLARWTVSFLRSRSRSREAGSRDRPMAREASRYPPLERAVLRWTLRPQIKLLAISLLVIPTTYLTLELPKHIVNHALASARPKMDLLGLTLDRMTLLLVLCAGYLAAITLNGTVKYYANVAQGRITERIVRRLRIAVVRTRARQQARADSAALISVAISECEPIGYFGGNILSVPVLQGGTLLTSLGFLLMQDVAMALAAAVMLPVQIAALPRLQARINAAVRKRVHATRSLSAALSHSSEPSSPSSASLSRDRLRRVKELEHIRLRINELKARLKSLYNFTSNLTPFFFFTIGGYLVIQERLSIGALVAALAAYREINPSLRALFEFMQAWSDARARYEEVVRVISPAEGVGQASGRAPRAEARVRDRQI